MQFYFQWNLIVSNSSNLTSLARNYLDWDLLKKINTSNFQPTQSTKNRKNHLWSSLLSEFSYSILLFHQKRKRERKKGKKNPSKEYFKLQPISNSSNSLTNHSFTTIQKLFKSSSNQYQDTCVVSHFLKQAYVPIFSKRKSTTFYTHTPRKGAPPKSYPLSRSVVAPFALFTLLPFVLFRSVIAIYALAHLFLFVSHCLSTNTDFYRVSSLVCLDTGSFNRFLRHLSTDVT